MPVWNADAIARNDKSLRLSATGRGERRNKCDGIANDSAGGTAMPSVLRRILACSKSFATARAGNASMALSLALPALLALVGGAVDYAAATGQRSQLQALTDAAALSVARQMSVSTVSPEQAQALSAQHINAGLDPNKPASVVAKFMEGGLAIKIDASQDNSAPFGIIATVGGATTINATALARVSASTAQNKLCILSLGEKQDGGIFMHNNSVLQGTDCILHSNSTQREAIIVQHGSKLVASLVCAAGGIANHVGLVQATLVSDCPNVANPLAQRVEPSVTAPCSDEKVKIKSGVQTLMPGTYCKGVTIEGTSKVTFSPGVYVFRDGPLTVLNDSEIIGQGVTFVFAGKKAYFRFLDNSLIQLSAPTTGLTAGMLIWESRAFVKGLNSWQNGGCGGTPADDDDSGSLDCKGRKAGPAPTKKLNEHHINSDRARELTGTIYLRDGLLLIDSRRPIADLSPFTILVVNKLDLFDGPQFMLNSNYKGTSIPVPPELSSVGGGKVRLGM
ncbi:Putative Flp pilus-assembly TadG-like, N-terminal [Rhabdaerophilaceae bacterium]